MLTRVAWFKEVTGLGDTELERLRWNSQLCCELCTCSCTWAMSKGLWKSHLQSSYKHNTSEHSYLLPFCMLLTLHVYQNMLQLHPKQYQEVRSLWKVGHAAKAISGCLCETLETVLVSNFQSCSLFSTLPYLSEERWSKDKLNITRLLGINVMRTQFYCFGMCLENVCLIRVHSLLMPRFSILEMETGMHPLFFQHFQLYMRHQHWLCEGHTHS